MTAKGLRGQSLILSIVRSFFHYRIASVGIHQRDVVALITKSNYLVKIVVHCNEGEIYEKCTFILPVNNIYP